MKITNVNPFPQKNMSAVDKIKKKLEYRGMEMSNVICRETFSPTTIIMPDIECIAGRMNLFTRTVFKVR